MARLAKFTRLVAAATLVGAAVTLVAPAAQAFHVACGQTITQNTTLDADIGPCSSGGIIIGADNVLVNLGGHTISGTPTRGDGAGILIQGRTGVAVSNGVVTGFDGGVVIEGGSGNSVNEIQAIDNIGGSPARYGDGIAIESSKNNKVVSSVARNNGPFSGIGIYSLVDSDHPRSTTGVSSGNVISDSEIRGNVISRSGVSTAPSGTDNDGIRVENNSTGNTFARNVVSDNGLDGISLFRGSANNTIQSNTVEHNGFFRTAARRGSGIIVFNEANNNTIQSNTVRGNADNGIALRPPLGTVPGSTGNRVVQNTSVGNVALPTIPSANFGPAFDLNDGNANCDSNRWFGNRYRTANPACTTIGGQQI